MTSATESQIVASALIKGRERAYDYAALPRRVYAKHTSDEYRNLDWYLRKLDETAQVGLAEGKLAAVVSAYRTMMEAVGLIGPQTSIADNRIQVVNLPDSLTTAELMQLALGTPADSAAVHSIVSSEKPQPASADTEQQHTEQQ